ncbi:MAG: hypothetical protein ACTSWP_10585 [Candidatus Freyarchaeota archaeon]|nr:hypothetical protein [Candidatus Freyrarchaeum guaymaensis]
MTKVTLVARGVDGKLYREFKAEAVRRGMKVSQAIEESMRLWLSSREQVKSEVDINNEAYERMREELEAKYKGKYAVISGGKLIGVCNDLREVREVLRRREAGRHAIVVKVGVDRREEHEWLGGSLE